MKSSYELLSGFLNSTTTAFVIFALFGVEAIAQPGCAPAPQGLAGWWAAEGSGNDRVGGNAGTVSGDVTFAPGKVGNAFSFGGLTGAVVIPASTNLAFESLTVEGWIWITDANTPRPIVEYANSSGVCSMNFWYNTSGQAIDAPGALAFVIRDSGGPALYFGSPGGLVLPGQWSHVALTFDAATRVGKLYHNGTVVASQTSLVPIRAQSLMNVNFGCRPSGSAELWAGRRHQGKLDEFSIYTRALSESELNLIYNAGSFGKCGPLLPPTILAQPTDQIAVQGDSVTFTVDAGGTPPLRYQWKFNEQPVIQATNATLILRSVSFNDAGNYSVFVSNAVGVATSSNAVLTVSAASPCINPPATLAGWWAAEGNGNDRVGGNAGTVSGDVTFAPGKVGQAFNFGGGTGAVVVPASTNLAFESLTVEGWIWITDANTPRPIVEYANSSGLCSMNFWYNTSGQAIDAPGALAFVIRGSGGPALYFGSLGGLVLPGQWSHVALTFDAATRVGKLYHNGAVVATETSSVPIRAQSLMNVNFGYRPTGSAELWAGRRHQGKLDEFSIYTRALSENELSSIYNAGSFGKCGSALPPTILSQPVDQIAFEGDSITFTVGASGTPPLSYQWSFNGQPLFQATNSSLTFAAVSTRDAGSYSVMVSNPVAVAVSSEAVLTVNVVLPCVNPPAALAGWWAAEGNGNDNVGGNAGTVSGDVNFASGKVGQAFNFGGLTGTVVVPASTNLAFESLTVEGWIWITDGNTPRPIVEYANSSGVCAMNFWYNTSGQATGVPGALAFVIRDSGGPALYFGSPGGLVLPGEWSHVALTFDAATRVGKLYHNGVVVATKTSSVSIRAQSLMNVNLGYRPSGSTELWRGRRHQGKLDEFSIYTRALSESELSSIYNAGGSGKCASPVPPFITRQPAPQTVIAGQNTVFSVVASGSIPLGYQWNLNGIPVLGATLPSLSLTNVGLAQAGNYSVLVTNAAGTISSSNALLTVNIPPALVFTPSLENIPAGTNIKVPVALVANGGEYALGLSLRFDPDLLTYLGVTLGSGAPGATLLNNSSQVGQGQLGIAVAMAQDTVFAVGTQAVAEVYFKVATLTTNVATMITFGDSPIIRQLSDSLGNTLAANYSGGTLSILPSEFEADISPRPSGNKTVTITDWVLSGRYAARLDYPTNAAEFQRADCAPRFTLGDGSITVVDWVQAGRYAAGLDPLTPAGGPDEVATPIFSPIIRVESGSPREVKITKLVLMQSETGWATVWLNGTGNENALGFSISFDPAILTYIGTSLADGASGVTLNVNALQAAAGKLGFVLGLGTSSSFPPGERQLLRVAFRATSPGDQTLALTDLPVSRQVADSNASTVLAGYINGTVTVTPLPSVHIETFGQEIAIKWPIGASDFVLQESSCPWTSPSIWSEVSATPEIQGNENVLVLPVSSEGKFYRLNKAP